MSQETVEVVRAATDAWNRGGWDEGLKLAPPCAVWEGRPAHPRHRRRECLAARYRAGDVEGELGGRGCRRRTWRSWVSKENLEVVHRSYEALLQGDWNQVAELCDPDVEMHGTLGGPSEGSVWRGVQQIRQEFQQEKAEASDEDRPVMERLIDAGDRVLMLLDEFGPGKGSGVEADMAVVFGLRKGRVVRIQGYMDRASAFEAAGLSGAGGD
jgi:ketosteroid isomerase-like protein